MVDLKKSADELTAKAAFAAARSAAESALEDALSSDEERAQKKAEQAALAKRKRNKLIAMGVVGLLLVLGLIGMVVSYWQWFFLLGLLGLGALYARHRWRTRHEVKGEDTAKQGSVTNPTRPGRTLRVSGDTRREAAEKPVSQARSAAATTADEEQAIEDELAALKARVDK